MQLPELVHSAGRFRRGATTMQRRQPSKVGNVLRGVRIPNAVLDWCRRLIWDLNVAKLGG